MLESSAVSKLFSFKKLLWPFLLVLVPLCVSAYETVTIHKGDLGEEFLLQTSYERKDGWRDLMTSRSRIVTFARNDGVLRMIEKRQHELSPNHVLATIPIRGETARTLIVDFNAGFDRIFLQEDRTGEDYNGRLNKENYSFIRLTQRKLLNVSHDESMLVIDQEGFDNYGNPVLVHYFLSPYHRNLDFKPFEIENLDHFGFYETYPRRHSKRTVLYAMKFSVQEPIVFALSTAIPQRYRQAVRDGVEYWNRAFDLPLLQTIDAPARVTAPSPDYNVIQWVTEGHRNSTSHIQSDPLTGEILHASIFICSQSMEQGNPNEQNDHLRYIIAHEVGHALGLRHNFAEGPVSTVMNYFTVEQAVEIGNDVIESGSEVFSYDRKVIRHVYLSEPLDVDTLPAFCTDYQVGCTPFRRLSSDRELSSISATRSAPSQ